MRVGFYNQRYSLTKWKTTLDLLDTGREIAIPLSPKFWKIGFPTSQGAKHIFSLLNSKTGVKAIVCAGKDLLMKMYGAVGLDAHQQKNLALHVDANQKTGG